MKARVVALSAWGTILVAAMTWWVFFPGQLGARDMLVVDHPALSASALGFGDLPARNVPQDGFLALAGMVAPASWVVRLLIVAAAAAAACGAVWLSLSRSALARAAAMSIAVANPFVIERLLQGHWSLVITAWLLPLIAAAGFSRRWLTQAIAIWVASLTPSGALAATIVGTATGGWRAFLVCASSTLPWVIPGILNSSTAAAGSAAVFAPRAEGGVGTLGALLGLGGIWNADAVPPSREVGWALAGVALFFLLALGARHCPRVLLLPALAGLLGAVLVWLLPLDWFFATVPGAGLLRDGQKLVMLAIPAYVFIAGALEKRTLASAALALALLQTPDAPASLSVLKPWDIPVESELIAFADGRDVFFPDRGTLLARPDGIPIVDPATKTLSMVESGALVVGGELVDPPSPRWVAAQDASISELHALGIGVVVTEGSWLETGAPARKLPALGLGLLVWWMAVPWLCIAFASASRVFPPVFCAWRRRR